MTLRGRLSAAFLAVVLGPVLLGAVFAGTTMAAVDRSRSTERLRVATASVRTSVDALCRQLRAAADSVALAAASARPGTAGQVVSRGLAAAVEVTDATGRITYTTPGAPSLPWEDCTTATATGGPVRALAARVDLRDPAGEALGSVAAAWRVDPAFVTSLAAVTGVAVTLLDSAGVAHSTDGAGPPGATWSATAADRVTTSGDGRYLRRVTPTPGQPLSLVLSVRSEQSTGRYAILSAVVLLAAALAVLAAWRLARVTTRPLAELAGAVDRVAQGDLTARVPIRSTDEIGRLAAAFNRMTRETDCYVQALTTSRDQLRSHLSVLGDTLSSTHDLHRILPVILHSAIVTTGARAGAVLLLDGAGTLVGQCDEGLADRWPDGTGPTPPVLRVPVGRGILGAVAATGEPCRGRSDPSAPPVGEPGCTTYVVVPLAVPGPADAGDPAYGTAVGALGVLVLYDRHGGDEFDDDDLVTLRTFAGQAAVAVNNVRVHEEVQRLSLTDPLTGLWNYRYLRESLRREVERAHRFGRMLSVLVLDLDRFKAVNDTYGHPAGDAVLAEFAHRLRGEIREVDLAFRQGGEEFVVLLPETDARGAAIVAERLGAAVRDHPTVVATNTGNAVEVHVTVSAGIAVYPDHGTVGQQVLDAADGALYAAKAAGRDTFRVAESPAGPNPEEMVVRVRAVTPTDGLPRAGAPGGASSGPQPPRQPCGR
ncbi:diguanylate cyclase [Micromonospora sp. NPDC000207]|uniref:diguanylate cyclase n=1 Tax=Micromonospora sp. NPDC000207 TaxID=3154246 RepID=UPI003331AC89